MNKKTKMRTKRICSLDLFLEDSLVEAWEVEWVVKPWDRCTETDTAVVGRKKSSSLTRVGLKRVKTLEDTTARSTTHMLSTATSNLNRTSEPGNREERPLADTTARSSLMIAETATLKIKKKT
jgi:hypothetical protein